MLGAVEALPAGRRIQRHYPHALAESATFGTVSSIDARQLVPEQRGRNDHPGMISTLIHLEIGAAGQCHLHLDEYFAFTDGRNRYPLDLHVLFAVEDGGCHLSVHSLIPSHVLPG